MRKVDLTNVTNYTKDELVYGGRDFRDSANFLWKDRLNFNIFDGSGYLTDSAKEFIKDNAIHRKDNETWGDAIFRHAELYEFGYQCDKAPKKRSDVKFSGSMILSAYLAAEESGKDYKPAETSSYGSNDLKGFTDGIDLVEMYTEDSYTQFDIKTKSNVPDLTDEEWEAKEAEVLAKYSHLTKNL